MKCVCAVCCVRGFVELPLHEHPTALEDVDVFVKHSGGWASAGCPFSAVVCLGGSMGAYEDDKHSWMPLEKQVWLGTLGQPS
jgi:hypothetical protein